MSKSKSFFLETLTSVLIRQHFSHGLLTARRFKQLSILDILLLPLNEMWISFVRKRKKWLLDRKPSLPLVWLSPGSASLSYSESPVTDSPGHAVCPPGQSTKPSSKCVSGLQNETLF